VQAPWGARPGEVGAVGTGQEEVGGEGGERVRTGLPEVMESDERGEREAEGEEEAKTYPRLFGFSLTPAASKDT